VSAADAVRVDKWLWAARFYKTRSAAQQAIEGGKVKLNGERTKPSKDLKPGDKLSIHIGWYEWDISVVQLSAQRGPAPVARLLYEESEESRTRRETEIARRRTLFAEPAVVRKGRPTKRERRELDRFQDKDHSPDQ
jgi:ribosome-associated heat shock protein Hsp15